MFKQGDLIVHLKSGKIYIINGVPRDDFRLESNLDTFYSYHSTPYYKGDIVWVRCKSEMEDGRFTLCEVN